ncbi:MAG: hypothetical protein Kow00108_06740 [Calditrichia bacterium]
MKKNISIIAMSFLLLMINTIIGQDIKKDNLSQRVKEHTIDVNFSKVLIENSSSDTSFVILDVRTPQEFNEGHIPGAININYLSENFANAIKKLDKGKTYLIYCRSGRRSAKALAVFLESGFENVYNMQGGFIQWSQQFSNEGKK